MTPIQPKDLGIPSTTVLSPSSSAAAGKINSSSADEAPNQGLLRRFRYGKFVAEDVHSSIVIGRWAWLPRTGRRVAHISFKGSILASLVLGVCKIVLAAWTLSPFLLVNGLYSLGIAAAKFTCLVTDDDRDAIVVQLRRYRFAGVMVASTSVLFAVYSIQLHYNPLSVEFSLNVALSIATVTFVELGINIQQSIVKRSDPAPLIHAARLVGLASNLIGLSLVQMALLSIASDASTASYNAWGGIFCGILASCVGALMVVNGTRGLAEIQAD